MPPSHAPAIRHVMVVLGLLAVSGLVQLVVIARSTVPALDAVRFARYAQSIDREGLLPTLLREYEQPLFPAWVWAVHRGAEHLGERESVSWAGCVQVAAAVPLVLALVPLYFGVMRLVGRRAAAAGCLLFCVLPEVARLGADGISDTTHLLFFCTAFWAVAEYFGPTRQTGDARTRPPLWLLVAGLAVGMALLARAEVLVLAGALGVALVLFQWQPARRQSWPSLAAGSACFLLGLAAVWGPFLTLNCSLTPEAALARVLGRAPAAQTPLPCPALEADRLAAGWHLDDGRPASFDLKDRTTSIRRRGYGAAVLRFARELADATGYWIGALALFGAWRLGRIRPGAGDRFVQLFFVMYCLAALHTAATEGYLASRHLLALVVPAVGCAGYGACQLGAWARGLSRFSALPLLGVRRPSKAVVQETPISVSFQNHRRLTWVVVALCAAACLPQTVMRIHYSREGHRMAAEWLEHSAPAQGAVLDTHGLTGLVSGRTTVPYERAPAVLGDPRLAYVVLEGQELDYPSRRSRTLRSLLAAGRKVAEFPPPTVRRPNQRRVLVYRWDADRFDRRRGSPIFAARGFGGRGTVPFSLRENWDSPLLRENWDSPRLGKETQDHVAIDTRVRR